MPGRSLDHPETAARHWDIVAVQREIAPYVPEHDICARLVKRCTTEATVLLEPRWWLRRSSSVASA